MNFRIDKLLFGFDPGVMHLENVLFHIINAILIYLITRQLVPLPERSASLLPLFVSLVFALHPVNTESVNWISGRSDLLGGVFLFTSMLYLLSYGEGLQKKYAILSFDILSPGCAEPLPGQRRAPQSRRQTRGVPFWATFVLGGIAAGLMGVAIAVPTLRQKGIFLALVTIGFQEIVFLVTLNWTSLTRGPMGIPGIPPPSLGGYSFNSNREYFYLILALNVVMIFVVSRIMDSRLGRTFIVMREDEVAAQSVGIPIFPAKVLSFVISTVMAGVAGAFFAHHARFVSADSFRLDETFVILTMLIVGGMGTIVGPVIGAVFLVILPEAARFLAHYREIVYGAI